MSKKEPQEQTFYNWFGVINHPKKENATKADFGAFNDILNKLYSHNFLFATIIHDKDILETGELKTIHMHLLLCSRETLFSKDQLLDKLSMDLAINRECISIEPATNLYGCVRYLTHKEQEWKEQYNPKDIYTNNREELRKYYLSDFEVLEQATTYKELEKLRNLKFIKDYKSIWSDVRKETKDSLKDKELLGLYRNYFKTIENALENDKDFTEIENILDNLRQDILLLDIAVNTSKKF